MSPKKAWS